jgi:hypothetical protein
VLLDFDTETNPELKEHTYTQDERQAIADRIASVYQGPNVSAPWFQVQVAIHVPEAPSPIPAGTPFATLYFNKTPGFGRPGGESDAIDFRNLDLWGSAAIQVNGLLGAENQPESTIDNFVRLSAKIGAHELGHLMGLRHQDAFGPIGFGLAAVPRTNVKPEYTGPVAAFETLDHLSGSPTSVGSDRSTISATSTSASGRQSSWPSRSPIPLRSPSAKRPASTTPGKVRS